MFDQENQDILTKSVFPGRHVVGWMRDYARLEDCRKIRRGHSIKVGFGSKDCQQVKNIEEELTVESWKIDNELLVGLHGLPVLVDAQINRGLRKRS